MKPTTLKTRIAGFFFALLMSATVLGATVAGMVAGLPAASTPVALDQVVVSAPALERS